MTDSTSPTPADADRPEAPEGVVEAAGAAEAAGSGPSGDAASAVEAEAPEADAPGAQPSEAEAPEADAPGAQPSEPEAPVAEAPEFPDADAAADDTVAADDPSGDPAAGDTDTVADAAGDDADPADDATTGESDAPVDDESASVAVGGALDAEGILRARREAEQQLLDELWDFADPAAAESRFRDAADDDAHPAVTRSVLATQLARALGLQSKFEEGEAVLQAVESEPTPTGSRAVVRESAADAVAADEELARAVALGEAAALRARIALERGRLLASAGRPAEAVPAFTRAAREAATAGSAFLALDALHMLALADLGHEEEWAAEALDVLAGTRDRRALRWGVAVNNNLGWHLHDSGRAEEALTSFERAGTAADEYGTREQRELARWAIARCLRTLGRTREALDIQRALAVSRPGDRWVHTEIALLESAPVAAAPVPADEAAPATPDEAEPEPDATSATAADPVSEDPSTIEP